MGFMKRPKAPKPTAQQLASERRTMVALDEETADVERRLKAAARGKLGAKSLLPTKGNPTGAVSRVTLGRSQGRRGASRASAAAAQGIMRFRDLPNGDER